MVDGRWTIDSFSTPGVQYEIVGDAKKLTCTCPQYVKRHAACKHIKMVRQTEFPGTVQPKKTDLSLYKSAIQKGVRRGRLGLVKTCFEKLWPATETKAQSWLMWRLPVIVMEENIGLYPWAVDQLAREKLKTVPNLRPLAWKILAALTLLPKNKDAAGLYSMVEQTAEGCPPQQIPDPTFFQQVLQELPRLGLPEGSKVLDKVAWGAVIGRTYFPFREAVASCRTRQYMGGMDWDKKMFCAGALLMAQPEFCHAVIYPDAEWVSDLEMVKPESLEWWATDVHSSAGRRAVAILAKQKKLPWPVPTFSDVYFHLESAMVDTGSLASRWWGPAVEARMSWQVGSFVAAVEGFRSVKPELQKLITGFLKEGQ